MLQAIRERAQGWFAWAIVILISVPFTLWGIQEYTKIKEDKVVAKVNGHDISDNDLRRQVQQTQNMLRDRLGPNYQPDLFNFAVLRDNILNDMISNQLTMDNTLNMGLRIGDAQVRTAIMSTEVFHDNGKFSKERYDQLLASQRIVPASYEQSVRAALIKEQFHNAITNSEFATKHELAEVVRLGQQQRRFEYFLLPVADFTTEAAVTDQELDTYYKQHQSDFTNPEQVKVDYLVLDSTQSHAATKIDEAELQRLYQEHIDQYKTPEQRQIRHILVELRPQAKPEVEQAARQRIQELRQRIVNGEDFATVAKEASADPGSAPQGGNLGMVAKGIMDPEFERASFDLPINTLSEPVRSAFGFHLIEVTKIEPEHVKPFAQVRDTLAAVAKTEEATRNYIQLAERLGNLTYEHPDSLEPAAQALGLTIQHSTWITKTGGTGVLADRKVTNFAFSPEVIAGNNSELVEVIEGQKQQAVVIRTVEHRDANVKPLAEVKAEITTKIQQQRAQAAALKQAQTLAEQLRNGQALDKIAGKYKIVDSGLVKSSGSSANLPAKILSTAFEMPPATVPKVSVNVVSVPDNIAVVVLRAITDGVLDSTPEPERNRESQRITQAQGAAYYTATLEYLRSKANIWMAPETATSTNPGDE